MTRKPKYNYWKYALAFFFTFNVFFSNGQNLDKQQIKVLFEARLEADGAVKPYVETQDIFGQGFSMSRDLIAQGEGTIRGADLSGTMSWSKLGTKHKEQDYNNTLVAGWIYTNDGAEIMYEAKGYAVRIGDDNSSKWRYTAALRFEEYV